MKKFLAITVLGLCLICNNSFADETQKSMNDYILIKYSDEIIDLFHTFKEITKSYGSQCLHEKGRTANQLFSFIYEHTIPFTHDDEYLEEEYPIDYTPINYYEEFY